MLSLNGMLSMFCLVWKGSVRKIQKQAHKHGEQMKGCQKGTGVKGLGLSRKGLRSTDWKLQNSHGDVKYSIGNIVSNIGIILYGSRWVLETSGGTLSKVYEGLSTMLYTQNFKIILTIAIIKTFLI